MENIVDTISKQVTHLLANDLPSTFMYHNLRHTRRVVAKTKELAEGMELSPEHSQLVVLAAWLHDVGYLQHHLGHERESCKMAKTMLAEIKYPEAKIKEVCRLIMATERGKAPQDLLEKIIKDADAAHLAQKDFRSISEMLRDELLQTGRGDYNLSEWRNMNIDLFRNEHRFYTPYALEHWQGGKDKNLRRLVKDRKRERRMIKKERIKANYKNELPDRGVQTLYRTTLRNHIKLSDIADTKSNILLSVNAIIISLALSNLIPKLDNPSNDYLIVPTFIFIVFSIASMILSISATRPNVTSGTFTQEDIDKRKVNLLFFGNFHKMDLETYEPTILNMLKDKDYIYSSLTKDLYYLGVVLERKYRILRWTYTIFMLGIIISVIAFGVAFHYFGPDRVLDVVK